MVQFCQQQDPGFSIQYIMYSIPDVLDFLGLLELVRSYIFL